MPAVPPTPPACSWEPTCGWPRAGRAPRGSSRRSSWRSWRSSWRPGRATPSWRKPRSGTGGCPQGGRRVWGVPGCPGGAERPPTGAGHRLGQAGGADGGPGAAAGGRWGEGAGGGGADAAAAEDGECWGGVSGAWGWVCARLGCSACSDVTPVHTHQGTVEALCCAPCTPAPRARWGRACRKPRCAWGCRGLRPARTRCATPGCEA